MSSKSSNETAEPRFVIELPGDLVARVPLEVLRSYSDPLAPAHASESQDVTAHGLSNADPMGGTDYHTDWEQGECIYDDGGGAGPQRVYAWHRHPFGTEYAEIFEG